jgi:predicted transcriptional regulator
MDIQRITFIKRRKPIKQDINEELQWLGSSLGLFGLRDKDKSLFRIFIEILKSAKGQKGLTSDELAYRLHLSRGTVVHHMKKLVGSGIVITEQNRYIMRVNSLAALVDEIRRDVERLADDLKDVASDIDRRLGL